MGFRGPPGGGPRRGGGNAHHLPRKGGPGAAAGSPGPARAPRKSSGAGRGSARRPIHEVKGELRSIYRQHVPEKSVSDVEAILQKFAGKEEDLLAKVRRKYIG